MADTCAVEIASGADVMVPEGFGVGVEVVIESVTEVYAASVVDDEIEIGDGVEPEVSVSIASVVAVVVTPSPLEVAANDAPFHTLGPGMAYVDRL